MDDDDDEQEEDEGMLGVGCETECFISGWTEQKVNLLQELSPVTAHVVAFGWVCQERREGGEEWLVGRVR